MPINNTPITVYITCPSKEETKKIVRLLLEQRVISCANFFPIESMYHWNNTIEESSEYLIFAKSCREHFAKIETLVKNNHSYEVPCIVSLSLDELHKPYLMWLTDNVRTS